MYIRSRHALCIVFMYILLIVSGCGKTKTEDHLFIKLSSSETNINFENILIEEELFNSINYLYFYDGLSLIHISEPTRPY